MKILLLGLGRWGANHLRNLHSLPVDLYVTDTQQKQLDAARKLGITEDHLSTDPDKFMSQVDAAVVVTPAQTHYPLVKSLLQMGKDVFVEKPITLISNEARELAELAQSKARILQVGHIFRFDTATDWFRQSFTEGIFGEIRMLRSNFSGFKRPRNDSGIAFADAIHFIDLFNYLLGRTPVSVHATMKDFLGRGMEDASMISMHYGDTSNAPWGIVETNYFIPGKFRELTVIGSELSAVCDFNASQYKIKTFQNRHIAKGTEFQAVEGTLHQVECPPEEPLLAELRSFIESVQTRKAPNADGWAGYHSVRILEAAIASSKSGSTVSIIP
jgi:predicted dehydrogenase